MIIVTWAISITHQQLPGNWYDKSSDRYLDAVRSSPSPEHSRRTRTDHLPATGSVL